jgi:signal peptidase I
MLGALCIIGAVIAAVFDIRPLVFRSGSMEPSISTGALALARSTPASELTVGDVVSVRASTGVRVTHRIVSLDRSGSTVNLVLKGDASGRSDAETYTVASADRVFADVPYLGYPIGYANGPLGRTIGAVFVAGLVWLIVRPSRRSTAGRRRAGAVAAVAVMGVVGGVAPRPAMTAAFFSDTGTVQSANLATHTMASQTQPFCENVDGFLVLGNIARVSWPQVDARYEYHWELRQLSGTVVTSGQAGAGQAVGTTVTVDVSTGLVGVNANYNFAVRARLVSSPTWTAATETITPVRRASIIVLGVSVRCGHA